MTEITVEDQPATPRRYTTPQRKAEAQPEAKISGPAFIATPTVEEPHPLRNRFAEIAFTELVRAQAASGKFSEGIIETWAWKFADAGVRGMKKVHRATAPQVYNQPAPEPTPVEPQPVPAIEEL